MRMIHSQHKKATECVAKGKTVYTMGRRGRVFGGGLRGLMQTLMLV